MALSEEEITHQLEAALADLAQRRGSILVEAIGPILAINRNRRRIHKFIGRGTVHSIPEYVERVADGYEEQQTYIRRLQEERANHEWAQLLPTMQKMARGYLYRLGLPVTAATKDKAHACAQEAAGRVLSAHFPYDTDFLSWLSVMIRFICLKVVGAERGTDNVDIQELGDLLSDPDMESGRQIESRLGQARALSGGIDALPDNRKTVIVQHYFEGKSFDEIAESLGKTVNAVYQLHFHALKALRDQLDR